jgi:hypothetical protein
VNTCKTCKHWGTKVDDSGQRLKSCSAPAIHYGYGSKTDAEVPDNGVKVENDEGWGIITAPDFGCVLHEVKP